VYSTHVKASTNKKKFTTEMEEVEDKVYQQELEKEIEWERVFAYSYHKSCDRNRWILQPYVTAANVHDKSSVF
jgi:hypothetical protein